MKSHFKVLLSFKNGTKLESSDCHRQRCPEIGINCMKNLITFSHVTVYFGTEK